MTTYTVLARTGHGVGVEQRPVRRPGRGEILLAPLVAGICGTDLQILRGLRTDPAGVLGHEGVAEVVEIGSGTIDFEVGATVVANPTHPADETYLLGHTVDGLWATRALIAGSAVAHGLLLRTRSDIDRSTVVLTEPLASVIYGADLARGTGTTPNSLVVWGDGTIGHLAAKLWTRLVPGIHLVHVHHTALGLAWTGEHAPGRHAIGHDDPDLPDVLAALPGPTHAIVATPRDSSVRALRTVDEFCASSLSIDVHGGVPSGPIATRGGPIDIAAVRAVNCGGVSTSPHPVRTYRRPGAGDLTIMGHRGVSNRHLSTAVDELGRAPARYRDLVTHDVDIGTAADLLTTVLRSGVRTYAGRRVVKVAIHLDDSR